MISYTEHNYGMGDYDVCQECGDHGPDVSIHPDTYLCAPCLWRDREHRLLEALCRHPEDSRTFKRIDKEMDWHETWGVRYVADQIDILIDDRRKLNAD